MELKHIFGCDKGFKEATEERMMELVMASIEEDCHDPHHKACPCHLGEQGGHWG
jgi:hypothetical protein